MPVQAVNLSSPTKKLYGLDHLRTVAIALVFMYHYGRLFPHPEWTNTVSKFGWTGVDLFFVLSGYLIASQLFAELVNTRNIALRKFYVKRFFRIIPLYVVIVTLYFCFPFMREREAPAPLWKYLSFTQNLGLDRRSQGTFSHAWSLCIEEQFYVLLPLVLLLLLSLKIYRKGYFLLTALFLLGIGLRLYAYQYLVEPYADSDTFGVYWLKWIYYPTYCRLDGLLTGISIAALFQFQPVLMKRIGKYGNSCLLLSLCILAGAYYLCLDETSFAASVWGFPLVSIGYGMMVIGVISPSCMVYRIPVNKVISIATLSYAIYLVHKIVIHVTQEQLSLLNIPKDSNAMFISCMILTVLVAWLLSRIIEQPFLRIRNQLLRRRRQTNPIG